MRENERKEETDERAGRAESFLPKSFISEQKGLPIIVHQELIYCPSQRKITKKKNQNQKLLQGIKWEENQKGEQKSKIQTSSGNNVAGLKSEQCAGEVVSQPAKFYRLRKFATLQNSCSNPISLHFLLFFPSGF